MDENDTPTSYRGFGMPFCYNGHLPNRTRQLQAKERGFDVPATIAGLHIYVCPLCGQLFVNPMELREIGATR